MVTGCDEGDVKRVDSEETVQRLAELERALASQEAELRALRRERAFYRALLEDSGIGIMACGTDGELLVFNRILREWCELSDVPSDLREWSRLPHFRGLDGVTMIPEELAPLRCVLAGERLWEAPVTIAASGKPSRQVLASGNALRDERGGLLGAAVFMNDVTEHKRVEESLRSSEAELKALFAAMDELIFVIDAEGRYLRVIPTRHPEQTRLSQETLVGRFVGDIAPVNLEKTNEFMRELRATLATGKTSQLEYMLTNEDGEVTHWTAAISKMLDDAAMVIVRDVTAQKQAEKALRESILNEELARARAESLEELSMPLIPISADVLVMPLVGAIDSGRMARMMETLLAGIAERRAKVVILDITGVPAADEQVAEGLIRVAQAVRLLGARVVLTGICPEVSRRLVSMGADWSGLAIRSSLQAGIALAMRREAPRQGAVLR